MKVLLSSHGAGPYGAERILLSLARGLSARGHDVVIHFPHDGPAVASAVRLAGVDVRVGGRPRLPRTASELLRYLLGIPGTAAAIRRVVREVRPDVVWVNSLFNPWAAAGARLAGVPVVWHLHERNLRGPLGAFPTLLVRLTAARAAAVSEYAARTYRRFPWTRSQVTVLPNPLIEPVQPAPREAARPFTVGCVGQLERQKRPPDVARALIEVPDAIAVFVGDGKARRRLEDAVRECGMESRTRILGFRPDVRSELGNFDCLVIPSLLEAFGLVAVEAMAAGVPVIAARSGALPEVLGDAALYHAPRDTGDLARQIRRLRDNPTLAQELRERGLRRATSFGFEPWIEAVEGLASAAALQAPSYKVVAR